MAEFFEVVSLEDALALREAFEPLPSEAVPLARTLGRVLAEDVIASSDLPPFRRATMDGYALRASSSFGASASNPALLQVVGEVGMGQVPSVRLGPGEAVRILTGGMLPEGADAVVMVEHTEAVDESSVEVHRSVSPLQHVLEPGEDLRRGEVLLGRGRRVRAQEAGLLAALGLAEVSVHRKPVVAILSTGDELVPVEAEPALGQIRDVNSTTLAALVRSSGGDPLGLGIVPDQLDGLLAASRAALARADTVLLSGGSSVGSRDYTAEVIRRLDDAEILVHGLAIKPGKPTILGRVGGKPFWGLPGHVTSAMVVYRVLVRHFVERLAGLVEERRNRFRVPARLGRNVPSVHGRVDYLRVKLLARDGELLAEPLLGPSGLLRTMVEADGLIEIGLHVEGLSEGTEVWVEPL